MIDPQQRPSGGEPGVPPEPEPTEPLPGPGIPPPPRPAPPPGEPVPPKPGDPIARLGRIADAARAG